MKKLFKKIYNYLFPKKINGKNWIESSMTEKWGKDWFNDCLEGLHDPEVRASLRKDLNLNLKYQ